MILRTARSIPLLLLGLLVSCGERAEIVEGHPSNPETPLIADFRAYCVSTRANPQIIRALMTKSGSRVVPITDQMRTKYGGMMYAWERANGDHLLVVSTGQSKNSSRKGAVSHFCSVLDLDDREGSRETIHEWIGTDPNKELVPYPVLVQGNQIQRDENQRKNRLYSGDASEDEFDLFVTIDPAATLLTLRRRDKPAIEPN